MSARRTGKAIAAEREPAGPGAPHDFASDNHAGAHPEVLEAIAAANRGHAASYGADPWTARARELFRDHFGPDADAHIVFNGTGANVAAIDATTRPHEGVICAETAHMHVDECGAPERLTGTKLLTVATEAGKLTPADVGRWDASRDDIHHVRPRLVSITQSTELGTVYTAEQVRAIGDAAHDRDMLLHVDGARIANAAAALGVGLREATAELGVDVLSFGATKNGLLFGDAVVFLRPGLAPDFERTRKQLGQLASKMRFAAAQFEALLGPGELWLRGARHANEMAARLAAAVAAIEGVELAYPVEANAVFARLPREAIDALRATLEADHPFYVWDPERDVVRWMCSWDTAPEDVDAFAASVAGALR